MHTIIVISQYTFGQNKNLFYIAYLDSWTRASMTLFPSFVLVSRNIAWWCLASFSPFSVEITLWFRSIAAWRRSTLLAHNIIGMRFSATSYTRIKLVFLINNYKRNICSFFDLNVSLLFLLHFLTYIYCLNPFSYRNKRSFVSHII